MADPITLAPAKNPHKEQLLAVVAELHAEIEADKCLGLVLIPIFGEQKFHVRSAGSVSMLRIAGLLGRAWMDATQALEDAP